MADLYELFGLHAMECGRCGIMAYEIYLNDPNKNETRERNETLTRLQIVEVNVIRPFLLRFARRHVELWLESCLLSDLVDIVVSYVYIGCANDDDELHPIVEGRTKKKRKLQ